MHRDCAFERALQVAARDIEALRHGFGSEPWAEYLLNPRRLRGSDFLMRWAQGEWSERRIEEAVGDTGQFVALPYGPSGVAPEGDVRAFELYFERLEAAGLGKLKRPDLLVIRRSDKETAEALVAGFGGLPELPFISEDKLRPLLDLSFVALECENSLWRAEKMPAFGRSLRPDRKSGHLRVPKSAVQPSIFLKDEDRVPLVEWERANRIPIHVWQVFFDRAYGIALAEAERVIASGQVPPARQTFQAPGGATTSKTIYKIFYQLAHAVGHASSDPGLRADFIEDKNGHILPFVRFEGGRLGLSDEARAVLTDMSERG